MTDTERTILVAAANLLRDDGIERVKKAESHRDRKEANAALLAAVSITEYLDLTDDDLPF